MVFSINVLRLLGKEPLMNSNSLNFFNHINISDNKGLDLKIIIKKKLKETWRNF